MSSGDFNLCEHQELFQWSTECCRDQYTRITYDVTSSRSPEETAVAMAMEQSASTVSIPGFVHPEMLLQWTARVVSIEERDGQDGEGAALFDLPTEVYRTGQSQKQAHCRIVIAYPNRLLLGRPSQWLNLLVGEIPRLGFIQGLRILDVDMPGEDLSGPKLGVLGLRAKLGGTQSPLLCRSMRPAVGLTSAVMAEINGVVLANGFHLVKDDELAFFRDAVEYRSHVQAMVQARKRAEDATGEPKLYIANLICEPEELLERLAIAEEEEADALLVAPAIQGLGILRAVARRSVLPVLAHNTFCEMFTRHPKWQIDYALFARLERSLGADWVVTQGPFGTPHMDRTEQSRFIHACRDPWGAIVPCMPILQGGKNPAALPEYVNAVEGPDFMLVVASWIDNHREGMARGARLFREAVDSLACGPVTDRRALMAPCPSIGALVE